MKSIKLVIDIGEDCGNYNHKESGKHPLSIHTEINGKTYSFFGAYDLIDFINPEQTIKLELTANTPDSLADKDAREHFPKLETPVVPVIASVFGGCIHGVMICDERS